MAADMGKLDAQADHKGNMDWEVSFVDRSVVPAHQHAAGAKGGSKMPRVWGVAQAALALRYTLKAEGFGKLMHFILTPGERHDTVAFGALLKGEKVKRLRQGRPKQRSRYLVGDKAYSSRKIRQQLRCSGITPVISCPSNRP